LVLGEENPNNGDWEMIYWFTGQPGHGKTVLSWLLRDYFEGKGADVIHIDGDDLRDIMDNKDYSKEGRIKNIELAQNIANFLHTKGFIVLVSLVSPYLEIREKFKDKMGKHIAEFYVHTSEPRERDYYHVEDYEAPKENFVDVDTTKDSPIISLEKILEVIKK
jgi:adenylylsulfate kinase